jgi:hypothetical protein
MEMRLPVSIPPHIAGKIPANAASRAKGKGEKTLRGVFISRSIFAA